jgi:hypothetical protein
MNNRTETPCETFLLSFVIILKFFFLDCFSNAMSLESKANRGFVINKCLLQTKRTMQECRKAHTLKKPGYTQVLIVITTDSMNLGVINLPWYLEMVTK